MEVFVNGVSRVSSLDFISTGSWTNWEEQTVVLNLDAGYNEIMFTSLVSEGGPNFDLFSWVSLQAQDPGCPEPTATATNTPGPDAPAEVFLCEAPGWASQNGGTIGGGSAAGVTVTTLAQLQSEVSSSGAKVIFVDGQLGSREKN